MEVDKKWMSKFMKKRKAGEMRERGGGGGGDDVKPLKGVNEVSADRKFLPGPQRDAVIMAGTDTQKSRII